MNTLWHDVMSACPMPATLLLEPPGTREQHVEGERISGDAPGTRCGVKQLPPGILDRRPWRVRRIQHTAGFSSTTLLPKWLSGKNPDSDYHHTRRSGIVNDDKKDAENDPGDRFDAV